MKNRQKEDSLAKQCLFVFLTPWNEKAVQQSSDTQGVVALHPVGLIIGRRWDSIYPWQSLSSSSAPGTPLWGPQTTQQSKPRPAHSSRILTSRSTLLCDNAQLYTHWIYDQPKASGVLDWDLPWWNLIRRARRLIDKYSILFKCGSIMHHFLGLLCDLDVK